MNVSVHTKGPTPVDVTSDSYQGGPMFESWPLRSVNIILFFFLFLWGF